MVALKSQVVRLEKKCYVSKLPELHLERVVGITGDGDENMNPLINDTQKNGGGNLGRRLSSAYPCMYLFLLWTKI